MSDFNSSPFIRFFRTCIQPNALVIHSHLSQLFRHLSLLGNRNVGAQQKQHIINKKHITIKTIYAFTQLHHPARLSPIFPVPV